MTRWRYAAATDTGLVRSTNQDAYFVDDSLAVVADGMGGHAAGEVASAMTVDAVYNGYLTHPTVEGVLNAVIEANRQVLADAQANPDRFGMGTTVVAVALTHENSGVVAPTLFHVGDSRAYQLRDGALRQLSADHSVAEEWVRMGRLTPEEALTHPRRHQLTRAIGVEANLDVDVLSLNVQPGDRLLLCSDGLSNELSPELLCELASAPVGLHEAVNNLIDAAKAAGGRDNITAALLEFDAAQSADRHIERTMTAAPPPVTTAAPARQSRPRRRRRFVTWRSVLGTIVLAGVLASAYALLHWYAYSTYYLGDDNGTVAIYQGQTGGVLWFKPVLFLDTPYPVKELRPIDRVALASSIPEPTATAALNYSAYLHTEWKATQSVTTTTVGTTTTTTKKG